MDELDILYNNIKSCLSNLKSVSFDNDKHRIGKDQFKFDGRGLIFYHNDNDYNKVIVVSINGDHLAIRIANNYDGTIFIDNYKDIDIYSPNLLEETQHELKIFVEFLDKHHSADTMFNIKLNSLVTTNSKNTL